MANKVAELFAEFKINFNKATLDVLNTTLGELRLGTIAEVASLAGMAKMLFDVGQHAMRTATHLHTLGATYGINAQRLQDMERAGLGANVSVEKMEASIVGLQQNLAALNLGQINSSFLEAAGFFGLSLRPGDTEKDVTAQLFKKVPAFVKAHGAMGRAMASQLLGQMGLAPEMLQFFLGGKGAKSGPNVQDKTIEALTGVSERAEELSFDVKNLGDEAISPLIEVLGQILTPLQTIASAAGGVQNIQHPIQTAQGIYEAIKGKVSESINYVSPEEARTAAEHAKAINYSKRYGVMGPSPLISASLPHAPISVGQILAANRPSVSTHMENHIYGVENDKIADAVKRAGREMSDRQKRDYAMHTAVNNPVAQ